MMFKILDSEISIDGDNVYKMVGRKFEIYIKKTFQVNVLVSTTISEPLPACFCQRCLMKLVFLREILPLTCYTLGLMI